MDDLMALVSLIAEVSAVGVLMAVAMLIYDAYWNNRK